MGGVGEPPGRGWVCWAGPKRRSDTFLQGQGFGCHIFSVFLFLLVGVFFFVKACSGVWCLVVFFLYFPKGKYKKNTKIIRKPEKYTKKYEKNTKRIGKPIRVREGGQGRVHGSEIRKQYGTDPLPPPRTGRAWRAGLGQASWAGPAQPLRQPSPAQPSPAQPSPPQPTPSPAQPSPAPRSTAPHPTTPPDFAAPFWAPPYTPCHTPTTPPHTPHTPPHPPTPPATK